MIADTIQNLPRYVFTSESWETPGLEPSAKPPHPSFFQNILEKFPTSPNILPVNLFSNISVLMIFETEINSDQLNLRDLFFGKYLMKRRLFWDRSEWIAKKSIDSDYEYRLYYEKRTTIPSTLAFRMIIAKRWILSQTYSKKSRILHPNDPSANDLASGDFQNSDGIAIAQQYIPTFELETSTSETFSPVLGSTSPLASPSTRYKRTFRSEQLSSRDTRAIRPRVEVSEIKKRLTEIETTLTIALHEIRSFIDSYSTDSY